MITHILVWLAVTSKRLGEDAREVLSEGSELAICTVSVQEIAYLVDPARIAW